MRGHIPRWIYGCFALLCALIAGAALGVLLFAYVGDHAIAVSSTARGIGYLIGLLFALLGGFSIAVFARHPRGAPPPKREHRGTSVPTPLGATGTSSGDEPAR